MIFSPQDIDNDNWCLACHDHKKIKKMQLKCSLCQRILDYAIGGGFCPFCNITGATVFDDETD